MLLSPRIIEKFVPAVFHDDKVMMMRASAFILLSGAIFSLGSIYILATWITQVEETNHMIMGVLAFGVIGYYFSKTGNFFISGNLMALALFLTILNHIPEVGGIYADGAFWLVAPPLFAMLFAGLRSGLAWVFIIFTSISILYVFTLNNNEYFLGKIQLDPLMYYMSQLFLFLTIFAIGTIFYFGQKWSLQALSNNLETIESQRTKLQEQAQELLTSHEKLENYNKNLEHKIETRAKQILQTESMYQEMVQHLNAYILETDENDAITSFNKKNNTDTVFSNFKNFSEAFVRRRDLELLKQRLVQNRYAKIETILRASDGKQIWALISCSKRKNEQLGEKYVYFILDLTDRKEMETNLIKANHRAIQAQRSEREFLARMSHEIRTPLNAIIGMTSILKQQNEQENQKEYIDLLESSSNILLGLLTDVLDFAKIRNGKMDLEEEQFNLAHTIKNISQSFKAICDKKGVTLNISIPQAFDDAWVQGNLVVFNRVLMNLLGNATKFTDQGSIDVILEKVSFQNSLQFKTRVIDTGVGIDKRFISKIFEPYGQVGAANYRHAGTGLGLPIVKQLIEMLNGDLQVNSQLGKGSEFSFILPLRIVKTPEPKVLLDKRPSSTQSSNTQRNILVVEDNVMNQKYISMVLKRLKHNFDLANDGFEALEMVNATKYDLIFMDVQMPGISGIETAKRIKHGSSMNKDTPIIALTASALVEIKENSESIGMIDFITKPYKPEQIKQAIERQMPAPHS